MKVTLHIPTEQYGFAEVEFEVAKEDHEGKTIQEVYQEVKAKFTDGDGITEKELNAVIDTMLRREAVKNGTEIYVRMNAEQKNICQALKRGIARSNYKVKNTKE